MPRLPPSLQRNLTVGCQIAVSLLLLNSAPASAQTDHASLTGTVSDPTQKGIPGARVTVKALATGIEHVVTTNAVGVYSVTSLPVGAYTATFDSPGFDTLRFERLALEVGETRVLNSVLQLGGVKTQISVREPAPDLDQTTAAIGSVIEGSQTQDLPLNGRSWVRLLTLVPGAIDASDGRLNGPMLRALLEERFNLKIHREIKEVPVYDLTIARGGLKAPRFATGRCMPVDWNTPIPDQLQTQTLQHCIDRTTTRGASVIVQFDAASIDAFIKFFLYKLDRPVIDKTGLIGLFDFHLEYTPHQASTDGVPMPAGVADSSIVAAVQQLGLQLTRAKGPGEYLVIDHVERPSPN
jgi:uncharacterized protein (TIGR03435 family)